MSLTGQRSLLLGLLVGGGRHGPCQAEGQERLSLGRSGGQRLPAGWQGGGILDKGGTGCRDAAVRAELIHPAGLTPLCKASPGRGLGTAPWLEGDVSLADCAG